MKWIQVELIVYLKIYVVENQHGFFSRKLRAGKRRTYFFDVRSTKQGDYFVTITESKRRFDRPGYDSHKIFLYKEDFKKFAESLDETITHIKTELNPDFDYDAYDREVYQQRAAEEQEEGNDEDDYRERKEPSKSHNKPKPKPKTSVNSIRDRDVSVEDKLKNDAVLHRETKTSLVDKEDLDLNKDDAMEW